MTPQMRGRCVGGGVGEYPKRGRALPRLAAVYVTLQVHPPPPETGLISNSASCCFLFCAPLGRGTPVLSAARRGRTWWKPCGEFGLLIVVLIVALTRGGGGGDAFDIPDPTAPRGGDEQRLPLEEKQTSPGFLLLKEGGNGPGSRGWRGDARLSENFFHSGFCARGFLFLIEFNFFFFKDKLFLYRPFLFFPPPPRILFLKK